MIRAINTAATGMTAQESNVNTIANNIANVNTNGFKKSRTEFEDLLYQTVRESGSRSSAESNYNVGTQFGSGAKVSATKRINLQGSPNITNNPYDLMIKGEGFFAVIGPNNAIKYTRDGSFSPDSQGSLVTKDGYKLFPGVVVPPNISRVNISNEGKVDVFMQDKVEEQTLGTIPIFTFSNPSGLRSEGQNLLGETIASGQAIQNIAGQNGAGQIEQGAIEASNVSIMTEMTDMIKAQRAYEMNAKVLGVADQMMQTLNGIR